jgi:hypothetical protein
VSAFKYLGWPLSSTDDDWPAIYSNLSEVRQCLAMVSRVLTREGADPRTSAMLYKVIVQSTLLHGAKMWDVTFKVVKAFGALPC